MAGFRNSNLAGTGSVFGENFVLGSQNNTPDETNGVSNAVSCYEEAVQFSASFVTSLFASFDVVSETATYMLFFCWVKLGQD